MQNSIKYYAASSGIFNQSEPHGDWHAGLRRIIPEERIKAKLIDRVSYASDAGVYHLLPIAVVRPVNEPEVIALFRFSHHFNVPLVFRAGGTSLSGQSITDGILVDLSQGWKHTK